MKPDVKYINKTKPRKTLNNINFKQDTVYPAHSLETPGFSPYVHKSAYDAALEALKMVAKHSDPEHASDFLSDLEETNNI